MPKSLKPDSLTAERTAPVGARFHFPGQDVRLFYFNFLLLLSKLGFLITEKSVLFAIISLAFNRQYFTLAMEWP